MDTNGNTKELIKDLCSRLPYGVIVNVKGFDYDYNDKLTQIYKGIGCSIQVTTNMPYDIEQVKPYLFPLSSMTVEQKAELEQIKNNEDAPYYHDINDFFLKYHLDNRHLIPKGLALDATGLNIY